MVLFESSQLAVPQGPNKRTLRKNCSKSSAWFCMDRVDSMRRRFCLSSMTQLYSPSYGISSKERIKTKKSERGKTWVLVKAQKEKYLATDSAPITRSWLLRFKSIVCIPQEHCMHSSWLYTGSFFPFKLPPKGIPLATSNAVWQAFKLSEVQK